MTYQEKISELHTAFSQASEKYIRAEKEFSSILGWGDSIELSEFLTAKKEFEEAGNKYHDFLLDAQKNNILPDQKFRSD